MAKEIPYHLGVILDGNRRWARENGLPAVQGHRKGLDNIKKLIEWCRKRGIKVLTLFVFSTENWQRSKKEIDYLMGLAKNTLNDKFIKEFHKGGIKLKAIGQIEGLSKTIQEKIKKFEELTKKNKEMTVNLAFSYGGRAEIVEAVKKIVAKKILPQKINEDVIKENLWTSDVDLVIRTGKVQRISNFLIWQAAYSELYFSNKYWPDFTERDLDEALTDYADRQRRFGK